MDNSNILHLTSSLQYAGYISDESDQKIYQINAS
jgi:hypothetical protein